MNPSGFKPASLSRVSDSEGRFTFEGIAPGTFWLEASQGPLHTVFVEGVVVAPGEPTASAATTPAPDAEDLKRKTPHRKPTPPP